MWSLNPEFLGNGFDLIVWKMPSITVFFPNIFVFLPLPPKQWVETGSNRRVAA